MARRVLIGFLITFIAVFFSVTETYASTSSVAIKEMIVKHSMEMGLDPAMALSIAKKESNFRHDRRSKYGAIGVFQLMPNTARKMGYNPYKVEENIKGGIQYYKQMYKMFGSKELALAAYNAGPGNVRKHKGVPPFKETRNFVATIMKDYNYQKSNPDPAIMNYKNSMKEIADSQEFSNLDFRMQHEAVLNSYLSNQGI